MVLMELARQYRVEWKKSRHGEALEAKISEGEENILLVLPLTFMNNSGCAVRDIAHFNKVTPEKMLVVVDDIRLDFGAVRLKQDGSDGGHNGLRSIVREIGSKEYARLRLGVDAPPSGMDMAAYVLAEFSARENKALVRFIADAADCCRLWIKGEMSRAMTQYNQRKEEKYNE
jgi:PTH1 family peptidyl-tRNA hydrolase